MIFVVSQFLFSRETSFELLGDLLLLIYIFILALLPDKVNEDNSFTISDYKEEQLLLSTSTEYSDKSEARLHYILHLINPMQPLKAKITFYIATVTSGVYLKKVKSLCWRDICTSYVCCCCCC